MVDALCVYSGSLVSPVSVGVWGLAKEDWRGVMYTLIATRLGVERQRKAGCSTGTACNSHHSHPYHS